MIRIKSTHPESQGPFVIINKADFDADKHEEYVEPTSKTAAEMTVKELQAALIEKGIAFDANAKKADLIALLDKPAE